MILPIAFALIVAGQETVDNPCEGPPSAVCEDMLASAALAWEKRYSLERAAHLSTIEVCATAIEQTPDRVDPLPENPVMTMLLIGAGILSIGLAFSVGAVVF